VAVLGTYLFIRATTPDGISYDPADEGYCEAYGITIDSSQVETVYLHPETILADPEAFLSSDIASLMLANRHVEANDPLDVHRWLMQIEKIAGLPIEEREQQTPYLFSRDSITGKETFCKIAAPHILSYLPKGTEISTTYYLAALDPINTGFFVRGGILTGLSHPVYEYAEIIFDQGSAPIYNNMVHELFHQGYNDAWLWQTEPPLENGALRTLLRGLQNDGIAVNAAYQITEYYPSSLDFTYSLLEFEPYVRYWIGRLNKVLDSAESKTVDELYVEIGWLYRHNVHYVVGGYMAGKIEEQLGRKALVATVETGPISFIQTYNSVTEEGMEIHFTESVNQPTSIYQNIRVAALDNDLDLVHENLAAIQDNPGSQPDVEADGYLLYNTGYILLKNGYIDLAEEAFRLNIALFPQVGAIYVGLGDVYVQRDNIPAAIEAYKRALELNERNLWVKVILVELQNDEP